MSKLKIAIIDYNMGNVKSIENAIRHVGYEDIVISSDHSVIKNADCIVLPGVGAFPDAMQSLSERDLIGVLNEEVIEKKKPVLGICLGMQLLFESSEEKRDTKGLGWIPGKVQYMIPRKGLRVPHIGWNSLILKKSKSIFDFLGHDKDYYFVHSLHAVCDEKYILAKFEYGSEMVAAVKNENVIGMQFHPEKSQKNGLAAMKSFLDWAELMASGNGND